MQAHLGVWGEADRVSRSEHMPQSRKRVSARSGVMFQKRTSLLMQNVRSNRCKALEAENDN